MAIGPKIFDHFADGEGGYFIGLAHWLQTKANGVPMPGAQSYTVDEMRQAFREIREDPDRAEKAAVNIIGKMRNLPCLSTDTSSKR